MNISVRVFAYVCSCTNVYLCECLCVYVCFMCGLCFCERVWFCVDICVFTLKHSMCLHDKTIMDHCYNHLGEAFSEIVCWMNDNIVASLEIDTIPVYNLATLFSNY